MSWECLLQHHLVGMSVITGERPPLSWSLGGSQLFVPIPTFPHWCLGGCRKRLLIGCVISSLCLIHFQTWKSHGTMTIHDARLVFCGIHRNRFESFEFAHPLGKQASDPPFMLSVVPKFVHSWESLGIVKKFWSSGHTPDQLNHSLWAWGSGDCSVGGPRGFQYAFWFGSHSAKWPPVSDPAACGYFLVASSERIAFL